MRLKAVRAIVATVAMFGLTAAKCTPEQIGAALRAYWGAREAPVDACRNDGTGGVLVPVPCYGQPSVDVVCTYDVPHAFQGRDYCLTYVRE